MCYKNEVQKNEELKLQEIIKDMPQFIRDYFVFLGSSKSKINYWITLRQLFEWLINQEIIKNDICNITTKDLSNVTDINIIKYLDGLKSGMWGKTISIGSINTKLNQFSGFWSYLEENDYVNKNIIKRIPKNKYKISKNKNIEVPEDEEIQQFIINIESMKDEKAAIRNIAIVKLFMGSGIRIEELVGLDVEDLYLDSDTAPYITVMRKGDQDEKSPVCINKEVKDVLIDYLKIRNLYTDVKDPALFLSKYKVRFAKSSIQDFFREYSNGKIHPHSLRHYVGTMLERNGASATTIADQLGHGDINTQRKYYVKKNVAAMSNAINSFQIMI